MANPLTDEQAWRHAVLLLLQSLLTEQTLLVTEQQRLTVALERLMQHVQAMTTPRETEAERAAQRKG